MIFDSQGDIGVIYGFDTKDKPIYGFDDFDQQLVDSLVSVSDSTAISPPLEVLNTLENINVKNP